MFDFIKNIGGKKSNNDGSNAPKVKKAKGFFLELDETGSTKSAAPAKQPEAEVKPAEAAPTAPAAVTVEAPKAETKPEAKKPEAKKAPAAAETVKIEAQPNPPAASNGKVEPQAELTFAPNYLLPKPTNSRRRPGPSMDMFRDMARQVKTPN